MASDSGLIFLFWTAFKLFGDDAPLLAMWKLQLIIDGLVIVLLFLATRMLLGTKVGLLASFLYAWFPFVRQGDAPIYFPVQTPFYYFWMIPFAVLSLLFWGAIFSGIGFYQNPYGIIHNDNFLINLARTKYGMKDFDVYPMSPQNMQTIETHMKQEVIEIWKKTPEIFFANAIRNFYYGFFLAPRVGLPHTPSVDSWKVFNFNRLARPIYSLFYALLLICGLIVAFLFECEVLGALAIILGIGLYSVLSVCLIVPPESYYLAGYFPIFYLLLAWGFLAPLQIVFQKIRRRA